LSRESVVGIYIKLYDFWFLGGYQIYSGVSLINYTKSLLINATESTEKRPSAFL